MGYLRTLIIIKPDAVKRKLSEKIMMRFEDADFKVIKKEELQISRKLAETHYAEHDGKEFYDRLINFITSGPSIAIILEGNDIVSEVRKIVGATNPDDAQPGTIRADFKEIPLKSQAENMVHASDSDESARREIELFFGKEYL